MRKLTLFYRDGSEYSFRGVESVELIEGIIRIEHELETELVDNQSDIQNHVQRITTVDSRLLSGLMMQTVDELGVDSIVVKRFDKRLSVKPRVANSKAERQK